MDIQALINKKNDVLAKLEAFVDIETRGVKLDGTQEQDRTALEAELKNVNAIIGRANEIALAKRDAVIINDTKSDVEEMGVLARYVKTGQVSTENRAMMSGDGLFVSTTQLPLVNTPEGAPGFLGNGVRMHTNIRGNAKINVAAGTPTLQKVAEGADYPTSDAVTGSVALEPHKHGFITEVSRDYVNSIGPADLESYINGEVGTAVRDGIADLAVIGTGVDEPLGVFKTISVAGTTVSHNTLSITGSATPGVIYDTLIDALHGVDQRYRKNLVLVAADVFVKNFSKAKDTTGQPIFVSATATSPMTFRGFPVVQYPETTPVTFTSGSVVAAFVNPALYNVAVWDNVSIERDVKFENDMVRIKARVMLDGALGNAKAASKVALIA